MGDRTSVQCVVVTGDLPLVFTWLKDDVPIVNGETFTNEIDLHLNDSVITIRQNDDFTSALSITSISKSQSGTYTCRVQNDAATVSHSSILSVNGNV